jgi:hypothetical protein
MPTNKKPRKRYKPRLMLADPLAYVVESVSPLHPEDVTTIALRNSSAMNALLQGHATKKDMDVLVALTNITEALVHMGFGADLATVAAKGREAIHSIVWRAVKILKFTPTGTEIQDLNLLMELQDAQMAVITVQELGQALTRVKTQIRQGNCDNLPSPVHPKA